MTLTSIYNDLQSKKEDAQNTLAESSHNLSKLDFLDQIATLVERIETASVSVITIQSMQNFLNHNKNMDKEQFISYLNEMLLTSAGWQTPSKLRSKQTKLIAECISFYSSKRF